MNDTELKIEKNVPLPPRVYGRDMSATALTALGMEVGDSVGDLTVSTATTMLNAIREADREGTQRKQADGTYRVWRTA